MAKSARRMLDSNDKIRYKMITRTYYVQCIIENVSQNHL